MNLYHTTGNGKVFGPFNGSLEDYKRAIKRAYGSLRQIAIAESSAALLYRYKTWDGEKWIKPEQCLYNSLTN